MKIVTLEQRKVRENIPQQCAHFRPPPPLDKSQLTLILAFLAMSNLIFNGGIAYSSAAIKHIWLTFYTEVLAITSHQTPNFQHVSVYTFHILFIFF